MSQQNNANKGSNLRSYLMRGLFFVIPIGVTIWLVNFVVDMADGWLGGAIRALAHAVLPASLFTGAYATWVELGMRLTSVLSLGTIFLAVGIVASFPIGKQGLRLVDHVFIHIPGVNSIYRSVRKMVEAFGDGNTTSFQRCVWLKFPAEHYTLGLVTKEMVEDGSGRKILAVFVPHGPNPTGGFTQYVLESETKTCDLSVEEGLKLVVSMGVLSPEKMQRLF